MTWDCYKAIVQSCAASDDCRTHSMAVLQISRVNGQGPEGTQNSKRDPGKKECSDGRLES